MKRVVVTGLGAITPLGNSVAEFWKNIVNGKSGCAPITKFDADQFKTRFACEVKGFRAEDFLDRKEVRKYDLFTQYAIVAADQAIADAGLDSAALSEIERYDIGVIWASGQGGIGTFEEQLKEYYSGDGSPRFNPYFIPKLIVDIAAGVISIRHQFHGPNYCTVSACASSNTAIINAFDTIRLGKAKVIITGGSEASITASSLGGFGAAQALSKRNDEPEKASRPFDQDRDGFVIGEGAGALVLEDLDHALARGARIYCEVTGGGMAGDAYHLTGTHPEGLGAALGMQRALDDAGIKAEQVSYINAHATSTAVGDISELIGVKRVMGDLPVPISATKSMTGHLLGAAGAVEAIISIKAIEDQIIPATINVGKIDEKIPAIMNIIAGKSFETTVDIVVNNTFGFGGHTATSIFARYTQD